MIVLLALALADPTGLVSLFSPRGMGRGCPISETHMLTARHLAVHETSWGPPSPVSVVWSDGTGASGSAWTIDYDLRRDLALMQSDVPFGRPYPIASEPPAIGDEVLIAGYEFGRKFELRVLKARILNMVAQHLILSEAGESGFSGSCVLNAQHEIVAIFHWGVNYGGRSRGVASSVWGPWRSVGWMPPKE